MSDETKPTGDAGGVWTEDPAADAQRVIDELRHRRRAQMVVDNQHTVIAVYERARARRMIDPVVVVANATSHVGAQMARRYGRDPVTFAIGSAELLLALVQSTPTFYETFSELMTSVRPAWNQMRIVVFSDGGCEVGVWPQPGDGGGGGRGKPKARRLGTSVMSREIGEA